MFYLQESESKREREREENLTVVASNLIISDGLQPEREREGLS